MKNETNLEQRDNSKWLDSTARIVEDAKRRMDEAEWPKDGGPPHPNAPRLRREWQLLHARYMAGEVVTPKF